MIEINLKEPARPTRTIAPIYAHFSFSDNLNNTLIHIVHFTNADPSLSFNLISLVMSHIFINIVYIFYILIFFYIYYIFLMIVILVTVYYFHFSCNLGSNFIQILIQAIVYKKTIIHHRKLCFCIVEIINSYR